MLTKRERLPTRCKRFYATRCIQSYLETIETMGFKPGAIVDCEGDVRTFQAGMNKAAQSIYKAVAALAQPGAPTKEGAQAK